MILGSVGSGVLMGLTGAALSWADGHSPAVVLLTYSVIGSLGTLVIATVMSVGKPGADAFRR
jgi:hypothetical protein